MKSDGCDGFDKRDRFVAVWCTFGRGCGNRVQLTGL